MEYMTGYVRHPSKIRVKQLLLQQSGVFQNQMFRPYTSYLDNAGLNAIMNRVEQFGPNKVNGNIFSGLSNNLISPSSTPAGMIQIPNGWSEQRARFVLIIEVEFTVGSPLNYFIQGFTDYLGYTQAGNIDPNLRFYINSITSTASMNVPTPNGVYQTNKIISSDLVVNNLQTNMGYNQILVLDQYLIRPSDVFSGIQVQEMRNIEPNFIDYRANINGIPAASKRSNNIPTQYLANVVSSYQDGRNMTDYTGSEREILNNAKSVCLEESLVSNPFIAAINNIYGNTIREFLYKDLLTIDPNVDNLAVINWLKPEELSMTNYINNSNHLGGADRSTVVAVGLGNSIPALMMEYLLTKVIFLATNQTIDGKVEVNILGGDSLTNINDPVIFETFRQRLIMEIINDFTYNNAVPFKLKVNANLFGSTEIEISLDNNPVMEPYVIPSFTDSLFTNVITPNIDHYSGLVNDFNNLLSNIREVQFSRQVQQPNQMVFSTPNNSIPMSQSVPTFEEAPSSVSNVNPNKVF